MLVRIISSATVGAELEQTKSLAYGRMTQKNGKYYVCYDEPESSGLEGTKTTLKWDLQRVLLLRSGAVTARQEFCEGLEDVCEYQTAYMLFNLRVKTEYLRIDVLENQWHIEIHYLLNINGAEEKYMRLRIVIEEDLHGN